MAIAYMEVGKGRKQDAEALSASDYLSLKYMDNGMDPRHFQSGLNKVRMEFLQTIKKWSESDEDYYNWR